MKKIIVLGLLIYLFIAIALSGVSVYFFSNEKYLEGYGSLLAGNIISPLTTIITMIISKIKTEEEGENNDSKRKNKNSSKNS